MEKTAHDGLSIFKRGWGSDENIKYFCGTICNRENYRLFTKADQIDSGYFPLHRAGELS